MSFPNTTARLDIGRIIEARLLAGWTNAASLRTPIQFPSVLGLRTSPTDDTAISETPPTGADWIRLDVIDGDTQAVTYGGTSGQNRCSGIIQIGIYTPRQKGDGQLFTLGGLAVDIFDRYHADGLRCVASTLRKTADDRGWLRALVRTPFEYYAEVS